MDIFKVHSGVDIYKDQSSLDVLNSSSLMNNTKTPAMGAETYETFKLVDAKIIAAVAWTYESLSLPVTTTWWTSSRITQEWA